MTKMACRRACCIVGHLQPTPVASNKYSGEDAASLHHRAVSSGDALEVDVGANTLLARIEKGVGVLTFNQPAARNALGDNFSPYLRAAIRSFASDNRVRCLVLTGAGTAFCSGGNVKSMAGGNDGAATSPPVQARTSWTGLPVKGGTGPTLSDIDQYTRQATLTGALYEFPVPTIAVLPGVAAGAGLSIALACDIRLAAESAFVTTAFRNIGLPGDYGASWLLPKLVGPAKAKQLFFTAERVGASEAHRIGIFQEVFADASLHQEAMKMAMHIASGPKHAIQAFKENLNNSSGKLGLDFKDGLDNEARRFAEFNRNEEAVADFREAAKAFVEKRAPKFS